MVECRSLGGFFGQDKYLNWIYDQTMKVFEYCSNPDNIKLLDLVESPDINTEESYEILGINLEKQLYEDTTVNILVDSVI